MGPGREPKVCENDELVSEFEGACRGGDYEFADEYKVEILRRMASNQGEAARLREALENLKDHVDTRDGMDIIREALSSHTEDTEPGLIWDGEVHRIEDVPDGQPLAEDTGIQKVRELYEIHVGSDDRKNRGIAIGIKMAANQLGYTIPGNTDGGDANKHSS